MSEKIESIEIVPGFFISRYVGSPEWIARDVRETSHGWCASSKSAGLLLLMAGARLLGIDEEAVRGLARMSVAASKNLEERGLRFDAEAVDSRGIEGAGYCRLPLSRADQREAEMRAFSPVGQAREIMGRWESPSRAQEEIERRLKLADECEARIGELEAQIEELKAGGGAQ